MRNNLRKGTSALLALVLMLSLCGTAFALTDAELDSAVNNTAAFMLKNVPSPEVGSVGGEWAVIGLGRSGYSVPDSYYETYYKVVEKYVKDCKGELHDKKYTEYSRLILGLTAAGYDPRNVAGYDLTAPLADFNKTIWQGVNGPIWALIALDSNNYPNPRRDEYIQEVLNHQLSDDGWDISDMKADPDMTGMALQALAPYRSQEKVAAAIDKALKINFTYRTSEGVSQMLVAYAVLGEPTDALVTELIKYRQSDNSSFYHVIGGGDGVNQMATEQAFYALIAAQRARDGKNSLYDMTDTVKRGAFAPTDTIGLPGKHADVKMLTVTKPGSTFTDITGHANKTAIEALAAREVINGKGEGRFDPDGSVTRAEFAKMVTAALGLPDKTTDAFTDVPASQWYYAPVGTAYYYEIINGIGDNKFNPAGNITRQEAAVMTARAAKLCGLDTARSDVEIRDTLAQFGDYRSAADWAQSSLAFCYDKGILDDSEFDIQPSVSATRAEIAEMLYRLLDSAGLL